MPQVVDYNSCKSYSFVKKKSDLVQFQNHIKVGQLIENQITSDTLSEPS